jgi:8-oxo-dGTP pyrophosphatase MutT (NUDIX family)
MEQLNHPGVRSKIELVHPGETMGKKSKSRKLAEAFGRAEQVAALPYRLRDEGLEFLVITSRRRKRLIVPKGWPMQGKENSAAAAIEADEEAGVKGVIAASPVGSFKYLKDVGPRAVPVIAAVFPLQVKKVKSRWKERKERKRMWLSADEAVARLDDGELSDLVKRYAEAFSREPSKAD